jgi:hypothetical protein
METIEQGLPSPPRPDEQLCDRIDLWHDGEGGWWTSFPPPADFDGEAVGTPGTDDYYRRLSAAEREVVDEWDAADAAVEAVDEHARRDRYFGFEGGIFSSPGEPNL